jgi:hypothetical protein
LMTEVNAVEISNRQTQHVRIPIASRGFIPLKR